MENYFSLFVGTSWGMNGYMKIERDGISDICHVASWAAYPRGVHELILNTTTTASTTTSTKLTFTSTATTSSMMTRNGIRFFFITYGLLLIIHT
jgi:hypothetical protein